MYQIERRDKRERGPLAEASSPGPPDFQLKHALSQGTGCGHRVYKHSLADK